MPTTRAQNRVDGGEENTVESDARQRNSARARARGGGIGQRGGGQRGVGHRTGGAQRGSGAQMGGGVQDNIQAEEEIFFDDEEPDIGKTLHAKDGKLRIITSKGFICSTNFIVDIASQVNSQKYAIKGYEVLVKKAGTDNFIEFFIPEADIYNPVR